MGIYYVRKINDLRKLKEKVERILNVKLKIDKSKVEVTGNSLDEYDTSRVFDAINFGFSVEKSLLLKEEDMVFKKIHIRTHTKRNLKDIKSRLIGKNGKTKRVISDLSNCEILIQESDVGLIGNTQDVDDVETAIVNIIKGTKQSNTYRYLEESNKRKKRRRHYI